MADQGIPPFCVDLTTALTNHATQAQMPGSIPHPKGHLAMPSSHTLMTMQKFFDRFYLPYIRQRKRSWELDESQYHKHIGPVFGQRNLSAIQSCEIENWLLGLGNKDIQASTCNRILAILKAICSCAVRYNFLTTSPCAMVAPLRAIPKQERFLTREEAIRLKVHLEQQGSSSARALLLLLLTGARKNEILKARWENVSLERQILTVPISKSGKARHISLSSQACEIIRKMRAEQGQQGCPWLFPGRDKRKPLRNIHDAWKRIRAELGLGQIRIHDLRHSFASFLAANGHTLYEVQKILGHADPRTTMRYAHLRQEQLVLAAESVSQLIGGSEDIEEAMVDPGAEAGKDRKTNKTGSSRVLEIEQSLMKEVVETAVEAVFEQMWRRNARL